MSLSNRSLRSWVYRPLGKKGGGHVGRLGKCSKGLPMMLRMIRNLSGSSPMKGLILRATGLYFFLPSRFINIGLSKSMSLLVASGMIIMSMSGLASDMCSSDNSPSECVWWSDNMSMGGYLASLASSPVNSNFNVVFGESNEYASEGKEGILSLSTYCDTLLLLVESPPIKNPLSSCGEGIFDDVHATSGAWVWSLDGQCSGRG